MRKNRFFVIGGILVLSILCLGVFSSCSSHRGVTTVARTPDFCNTTSGVAVAPVAKKPHPAPAPDTPIGGNFAEKRR